MTPFDCYGVPPKTAKRAPPDVCSTCIQQLGINHGYTVLIFQRGYKNHGLSPILFMLISANCKSLWVDFTTVDRIVRAGMHLS